MAVVSGMRQGTPAAWMPYFVVEPRQLGDGRFCVVRDPVGAITALAQL